MIVANFALCLLLSKSELRFKKGHFVFPQQKKYARQQKEKKPFLSFLQNPISKFICFMQVPHESLLA
jgi:hypothetical protein